MVVSYLGQTNLEHHPEDNHGARLTRENKQNFSIAINFFRKMRRERKVSQLGSNVSSRTFLNVKIRRRVILSRVDLPADWLPTQILGNDDWTNFQAQLRHSISAYC